MAYGMAGDAQVQFQNSFGTSSVVSLEAVPIVSEGLAFTIEQLPEENMYSRFAESPYHEGMHGWEGALDFEVKPSTLGYFLKGALGQVTTTSDTGLQSHVFEPKQSDFDDRSAVPPMNILVNRDTPSAQNCGQLYFDGNVNEFSLEIANNTLLKANASFIGANKKEVAIVAPTYNTDEKPFTWDVTSASINGVAVCDFKTLNLTYNNNLETQHVLCGSKTPYRIQRTGFQTIEVTGTLAFRSNSFNNSLLNQTEAPLIMNFVGDTPHTLKVEVPLSRHKDWAPVMGGPGEVEVSIAFQAMYSTTSNTALRVTLVNTQANY
jgi:hypothetical protein